MGAVRGACLSCLLSGFRFCCFSRARMQSLLDRYGELVVQQVGWEVDRLERAIVAENPAIKHIDLEASQGLRWSPGKRLFPRLETIVSPCQ